MRNLRKKIDDLIFSFEMRFGWFFVNGRKQDEWAEKLKKEKQKRDDAKKI